MKNIFFDTNILIDVLLDRKPFSDEAYNVFSVLKKYNLNGFISSQSIPNMFYILRKDFSLKQRRDLLLGLCEMFFVVDTGAKEVVNALLCEKFDDYEDCLQALCAAKARADCIITRNIKDFDASEVRAVTPSGFLEYF